MPIKSIQMDSMQCVQKATLGFQQTYFLNHYHWWTLQLKINLKHFYQLIIHSFSRWTFMCGAAYFMPNLENLLPLLKPQPLEIFIWYVWEIYLSVDARQSWNFPARCFTAAAVIILDKMSTWWKGEVQLYCLWDHQMWGLQLFLVGLFQNATYGVPGKWHNWPTKIQNTS
jgi:hypothetical protein